MLKIGDKIKITKVLGDINCWADKGVAKDRIYTVNFVGGTIFKFGDYNISCFIKYDPDFEYEIVKENDNMKKLTFKEVIANIKIGETWENKHVIIGREPQKIRIKEKNTITNGEIYFDNEPQFTLRRNKVSFAEAFKAYEEGKEIESCLSGFVYFKFGETDCVREENDIEYEWGCIEIFEIRGEWYIND